MTGSVRELRTYRLKGAAGESHSWLSIDSAVGVVGDRRFAVKRRGDVPDEWSPKGKFFVGMNAPQMVSEHPMYDGRNKASDGLNHLKESYVAELGERLGIVGPVPLLDTQGTFNATDTEGPTVSFLNLASVHELEKFMGKSLDPYRFRMNVHLQGLAPFEELEWVTRYPGERTFKVGSLRFRLHDMCERCKAIEANPRTGERDLEVLAALAALLGERGYEGSPHRNVLTVMGVIAVPLDTGSLWANNVVML